MRGAGGFAAWRLSRHANSLREMWVWGLDNTGPMHRIRCNLQAMQLCEHRRTEMLARRDGVDYVRCLDCDQVFEAEDLEQVSVYDDALEDEETPRGRRRAS